MSLSRIMKFITGSLEALLGIPILGGAYIIGNAWAPLFFMLFLHLVTLVLTKRDRGASAGSILGIITSLIGWIPFVGFLMHVLTAIVLFITGLMPDRESA
ncbi:hypothetical protein QGM71_13525 [Virgibacillus sp. C22-A2]|uniref:DUF4190 domain-containing protein n=1 Tax=Virgibacillus tibetensis TaxID=3042313 RepID=A0ABU6KI02_9BACI|nr:hypothetical protein [Virgibacillus sp. C22-A2]